MELSDIQNFLQFNSTLATAGQPLRHQFAAIPAAGYEIVINLALPVSLDAVAEEAEIWAGLGVRYFHIPVEWEAPLLENLEEFFKLMHELQGQKVFVHCARNLRVSSFVYLYRVLRLGQPQDECRQDLEKIWQPNEVWEEFITEALK